MGNATTNNTQITINTKYTKLENLIKEFNKNVQNLKKIKINSLEDLKKSQYIPKIENIQMEINNEIIKIRNTVLNSSSNINEYTKSNIKIKKYIFDIQKVTQEYFELIRNKSKFYIYL